jgi:hypothetical protein
MQARIRYAREEAVISVEPDQRFSHHRGPAPVPDTAATVRQALEAPFSFPPLRQAMTPDDIVALVVDESLANLSSIVGPVLEVLGSIGTTQHGLHVVSANGGDHGWTAGVPAPFAGQAVETHDPNNKAKLAYVASTKAGRRLYFNRTVVEAEQVIVVSARRFQNGQIVGGNAALFPALADEAAHGASAAETREAIWLLGLPFQVQIIESVGDGVASVVAGAEDAIREAERLLTQSWRLALPRRADTAVVTLTGDPARHTWDQLARTAACGADVVQPGGRVVVLAGGSATPGPEFDALRKADGPEAIPGAMEGAARDWARAVNHARISLLTEHGPALIEEMFATPLSGLEQVQRLVARSGDCVVIEDANRFLVVVE